MKTKALDTSGQAGLAPGEQAKRWAEAYHLSEGVQDQTSKVLEAIGAPSHHVDYAERNPDGSYPDMLCLSYETDDERRCLDVVIYGEEMFLRGVYFSLVACLTENDLVEAGAVADLEALPALVAWVNGGEVPKGSPGLVFGK